LCCLVFLGPGMAAEQMAAEQLISLEEIKKHTKEEDCWLAIYGARQHLSARVAVLPVAQGVSTCVSKWCHVY